MENSKLKIFIPLLYLVWSDDLLTQKEFLTLQNFILSQTWLSAEEQKELISKLDTQSPPSRAQINDWKSTIDIVLKENNSIKSVFEISLVMSGNNPLIKDLSTDFIKLENDLGISGLEIMDHFKTTGSTLTASYQGVTNFEIEKLTKILDGEQALIINKVKSIISRPEFATKHLLTLLFTEIRYTNGVKY